MFIVPLAKAADVAMYIAPNYITSITIKNFNVAI